MAEDPSIICDYTIENICRLCLDDYGHINIFQSDILPEQIYTITSIKVYNADKLPSKLCKNCYEIIKIAVAFREAVLRNNQHLYATLNNDLNSLNESSVNTSTPIEATETIIIKYDDDSNTKSSCDYLVYDCSDDINQQATIKLKEDIFSLKVQKDTIKKSAEDVNPLNTTIENVLKNANHTPKLTVFRNSIMKIFDIENKELKNVEEINLSEEMILERTESNVNELNNYSEENSQSPKKYHITTAQNQNFEETCKPSKRIKFEDDLEFTCEICMKFFETSKKLYIHRRIHNRTHKCSFDGCEKKFATKGDLQKHNRTHTGEKPFVCEICKKKFAQNVSLRQHKKCIHDIEAENLSYENRVSKILWGD